MCTADDAGSKRAPPRRSNAPADSEEGSSDAMPQKRTRRNKRQISPDNYKPEAESASEDSSICLSEGDFEDLDSSFEKKPTKITQSAQPAAKKANLKKIEEQIVQDR